MELRALTSRFLEILKIPQRFAQFWDSCTSGHDVITPIRKPSDIFGQDANSLESLEEIDQVCVEQEEVETEILLDRAGPRDSTTLSSAREPSKILEKASRESHISELSATGVPSASGFILEQSRR